MCGLIIFHILPLCDLNRIVAGIVEKKKENVPAAMENLPSLWNDVRILF